MAAFLRRFRRPVPMQARYIIEAIEETAPPRMVRAHTICKSNETNKISKRTSRICVRPAFRRASPRLGSARFAVRVASPRLVSSRRSQDVGDHVVTKVPTIFDHVAERCSGRYRGRKEIKPRTYISRCLGLSLRSLRTPFRARWRAPALFTLSRFRIYDRHELFTRPRLIPRD